MFWTIVIIFRAVRFRTVWGEPVSSSHFGFDVPAPVWQLPQQRLSDVVKTPIVPMNSSTGMPFSTWTFLNTTSDISVPGTYVGAGRAAPRAAGAAGGVAGVVPRPAGAWPRWACANPGAADSGIEAPSANF